MKVELYGQYDPDEFYVRSSETERYINVKTTPFPPYSEFLATPLREK